MKLATEAWNALRLLAWSTLLCGLAYPLLVTLLARLVAPARAGGSLIERDGVRLGSELVAREWRGERWFHGRPSATTFPSGGSNLGPTSPALAQALETRARALRAEGATGELPAELLTASASGLDPHLGLRAALLQVPRIARARGLPEARVREQVERLLEPRLLGFLGEPCVNVLRLNLALEQLRQP